MKRKAAVTAFILIAITITLAAHSRGNTSAQTSFSLASLKGSYAGLFSGHISTPTGLLPVLGTGIFVSDGAGKLSGHESYTVNGVACTATISGTYTVKSDGTGTNAVNFATSSPGCVSGSYTQSFAIAEGGRFVVLSNSNSDQITEEWRRQ